MNDKVYIHELIDIRGHHRADYMHHMLANWSPLAQETRHQLAYGVWALLGSTGAWPQTVNMWEEDGWDGIAESFGGEAVGSGAQDPALAKWWAKASEFRRGGFDRIVVPAPWTRTIEQLCADGVRGDVYAHELVKVRPGSAGRAAGAGPGGRRAGARRPRLAAGRRLHHRDGRTTTRRSCSGPSRRGRSGAAAEAAHTADDRLVALACRPPRHGHRRGTASCSWTPRSARSGPAASRRGTTAPTGRTDPPAASALLVGDVGRRRRPRWRR